MKYFMLFLLMASFNSSFAQVENGDNRFVTSFLEDLPKRLKALNLKDLRNAKDTLSIRIWNQGITTLNATSPTFQLCIGGEKRICKVFEIPTSTSMALMDTILSLGVYKLKDDGYRGIDGHIVTIEILHNGSYKVFSYWSPRGERHETNKSVVKILNAVGQKLSGNDYADQLLQTLKPGEYSWGMSTIYIDRFLKDDIKKTDFYLAIKNRIKSELNIDENTSLTHFPLILINNVRAQISDLNKYSNKDVIECTIVKPELSITAIYGGRAVHGVLMVKTK